MFSKNSHSNNNKERININRESLSEIRLEKRKEFASSSSNLRNRSVAKNIELENIHKEFNQTQRSRHTYHYKHNMSSIIGEETYRNNKQHKRSQQVVIASAKKDRDIEGGSFEPYVAGICRDIIVSLNRHNEKLSQLKTLKRFPFDLVSELETRLNEIRITAANVTSKGKLLNFTSQLSVMSNLLGQTLQEVIRASRELSSISRNCHSFFKKHDLTISDKDASAKTLLSSLFEEIDEMVLYNQNKDFHNNQTVAMINEVVEKMKNEGNSEKLQAEIQSLKEEFNNKSALQKQKLEELDNMALRYDHDRKSFRQKYLETKMKYINLEEEFGKVKMKYEKIKSEIDVETNLKDRYFNISMMQISDHESYVDRNSTMKSRYITLFREHEELKREMAVVFQERETTNFEARQQEFDKSKVILEEAAKFDAPLNVVFKMVSPTANKNQDFKKYSKNTLILRPSYKHFYLDQ